MGGWVGPRPGLEDVERRKTFPYRDSISDPSAIPPVARRYTDCTIPAPLSLPTIGIRNYFHSNLHRENDGRENYSANDLNSVIAC
jgi:hypothetical protein